ncbi:MAG: peptidoglycan DD-metalloendopeptidase family protein, partial [Nitrosomonadales bacterium]|nr:peptidoglycan DD-metalloendopeptidase family protein [Nitrosomonadales bacterium]
MIRFIGLSLFCTLLIGCASNQQAPVIDRMPGKPAAKAAEKDWRPDLYTVKRGDTLYSIGLEHGYDYREIAQTNNISPPYVIHVGQQLRLKPRTAEPSAVTTAPVDNAVTESSGVVITPLDLGGSTVDSSAIDAGSTTTDTIVTSSEPPLINEPRALREPYSEQALNAPIVQAKATPTTEPTTVPTVAETPISATAEPNKTEIIAPSATATSAGITWSWPTTGKVLTGFNDAGSAKGIDIGGTTGQAITAAAPGKVIYSGSDLRGYGKLVIVKHNADFLSVYAHNSKILVKEGDQVARGQKIAEMGNTDTDKTKLHFEIRRQGKSVDPATYLPANP